jgi:AP-2 complex subunit alpha
VKLRLPTLMNKIFQAAPVSASDFVAHWRAIAGPPTKLQEVDPNVNNIVAATTFFSQAGATLCLVRVETDPSDRTQMRLTVASQDPNVTYEVKEFIKEQVIDIPFARTPAPIPSPAVMGLTGPAAALAGLI